MEIAILSVEKGRAREFEEAFAIAQAYIARVKGYIVHELHRCLEDRDKYLLVVEWEKLEDHTIGFRQSAEYQEWKRLLHHFYHPFPTVEHYEKLI